MKKSAAIAHFGSESNLAKALGITRAAVNQWPDDVPRLRAFELEKLTEGKLKRLDQADLACKAA
ncbi:Cro/CI family transcriptional regulator [Shewanella sp. 3B26]|uniref:Cro/CI family transcriptional regulator n=1 Tax=Shewanella zhuhaiensis TaxID=2919576 RepID=A0AAJ1EZM3_9GAMM|nr:Cro/CI family transcriptional regulator [Shewanella zhuhaiensis]MCH4294201.1 Cro/CI family transcriptional regulator [Shewanella zhuhaiensis]